MLHGASFVMAPAGRGGRAETTEAAASDHLALSLEVSVPYQGKRLWGREHGELSPVLAPVSRSASFADVYPISNTGSSPAPTIQVTIGRVEVRAVAATAPPKRSAQTGPALSLNDYLSQRGGRSR